MKFSRGSGESARLPPMCPGFDSRTRRDMWVEFVVGSRLCSERFFSRYSGFPLSSKTNTSKFQFQLGKVSPISAKALGTFDTQIKVILFISRKNVCRLYSVSIFSILNHSCFLWFKMISLFFYLSKLLFSSFL